MSGTHINVTVTDPVKLSDTFGAYIVYRVNTSTNSSEFNSTDCSVTRRYSDFEWLHDQLSFFYPASITPPLPEKQTVGRFTPEFIESRRRGIEKFMGRVTTHPILKEAAVVASFLQVDDSGFSQCKAQYKQDRAAASGSMAGWLGDKMNTMTTNTFLESTEDDANVQGALDYVLAWERQLSLVAKQSSQIVKSCRDKSKALYEFGQAFSSLGLNETNEELANVLSVVGVGAAKLASIQSDAAVAEATQFEEPMHECCRILGEIKNAIKRRGDKWQELLNATADSHAKQASYEKVLGVAGKEDMATSKLVLMETAQERVEKAQTDLDAVSKQLLEEVAAFKISKAVEFKAACREFVKVLIELNNDTEALWKDVLPTLKEMFKKAPKHAAVKQATRYVEKEVKEEEYSAPKEESTFYSATSSTNAFHEEEQEQEQEAPPPPAPSMMNEIDIDDDEEDEAGV